MSLNSQDKQRKSEPDVSSKSINKDGEVYYKKTKANAELIAYGRKIIESMSEKEYKQNIGSKTNTLHFIVLLGLASKRTTRKVNGSLVDCSTPVGVRLKTDIDIEVSFLKDVTKNKNTGIDLSEDIEYKIVNAGEFFDLTLYEFMFLIIRDEYGGLLKVDGEDYYAYLSVISPAFIRGDAKLPTPSIKFDKGNGPSRVSMVDIDEQVEGKWVIKPQYERFTPLVRNRRRRT